MSSVQSSSKIVNAIGFIAKSINVLGMVVLVAMMLLTVADVSLRYFLNSPIMGGTEITEYMMVCLFLGVPWCMFKGGAIKMDLLVSRFPDRVQAILDAVTDTFGLLVMVCLTWQLFKEMRNAHDLGISSTVLGISSAPFYGVLSFAVGMLAIVLAVNIVHSFMKGVKR